MNSKKQLQCILRHLETPIHSICEGMDTRGLQRERGFHLGQVENLKGAQKGKDAVLVATTYLPVGKKSQKQST